MNTLSTVAANNNINPAVLPTVTRDGATLVYRNLAARDSVLFGRKFEGAVSVGNHAAVEKGVRVVLWGVNKNRTTGILPYRTEFAIGDSAIYGSYNLIYTGKIVAIGDKTITIEEPGGKKHRHTIAEFSRRNRHFDADYVFKNNSEWMD